MTENMIYVRFRDLEPFKELCDLLNAVYERVEDEDLKDMIAFRMMEILRQLGAE